MPCFIEHLINQGKAIFSSKQDQARLYDALQETPVDQSKGILNLLVEYGLLLTCEATDSLDDDPDPAANILFSMSRP